jgi:hypothetical protein
MTISIIATAGANNANSYATLEEADAYFLTHPEFNVWGDLDDEDKKRYLISYTRKLDLIIYAGRKLTQAQSLQWPRSTVYDRDGYAVTGVPSLLKDALFEWAIHDLTEDDNLAGDFELENLEQVEIGPIKYTVRAGAYNDPPSDVTERLNMIGPFVVLGGAGKAPTSNIMVL